MSASAYLEAYDMFDSEWTIRCRDYSRPARLLDREVFYDIEEAKVVLDAVPVSRSKCLMLCELLNKWLESREVFSCSLCAPDTGRSIECELSYTEGGADKDVPTFIWRYRGRVKVEVSLQTDQSCIRLAYNSLYLLLSRHSKDGAPTSG